MADDYTLGEGLIAGLTELRDWQRGKIALEVVKIAPMAPETVKTIRKRVAKSARVFEARFGIPAATLNNWEQGRREPDVAARLLLKVIEAAPDIVERVAHGES
jgi:putative transcriptional regulator